MADAVGAFLATPAICVTQQDQDALYVGQGEWALVPAGCTVDLIGSDDATTCHIVALVDKELLQGRVTAVTLGHFGSASEAQNGLKLMWAALQQERLNQRNAKFEVEVHVAGGLPEDASSVELTSAVEAVLKELGLHTAVSLMATASRNRAAASGRQPAVRGLAVRLSTGQVGPAKFEDAARGPLQVLRHLRFMDSAAAKPQRVSVYEAIADTIVVEPFAWPTGPWRPLARMPSEELLKHFSTSPEEEQARFPNDLRAGFNFMAENPRPHDVFSGKPLVVPRRT